jgi:hypothetical protein
LPTADETDGGAVGAIGKKENGVASLSDKQIISLMKEYAGTGKPARGSVAA